jgi:hypothetical protein
MVESIECTPEHQFLIWNGRRSCSCGCNTPLTVSTRKKGRKSISGHHQRKVLFNLPEDSFIWCRADELHEEDFLCIPISLVDNTELPIYEDKVNGLSVTITSGIARLLGYWAAEGSFMKYKGKYRGLSFGFNLSEKHTWGADVVNLFKQEFGIDFHLREASNVKDQKINAINVYKAGIPEIAEMFYYYCGEYSHLKRLPTELLQWPIELQKQLLIGYMRGDGSWHNKGASFGSTSRILAEQICGIFRNLGVDFVIKQPRMFKGGKHLSTHGHIAKTGDGARELLSEIFPAYDCSSDVQDYPHIVKTVEGFRAKGLSYGQTCLALAACGLTPSGNRNIWTNDVIRRIESEGRYFDGHQNLLPRFRKGNYIVTPIESIERVEHNDSVYCLSVDEDESFLV